MCERTISLQYFRYPKKEQVRKCKKDLMIKENRVSLDEEKSDREIVVKQRETLQLCDLSLESMIQSNYGAQVIGYNYKFGTKVTYFSIENLKQFCIGKCLQNLIQFKAQLVKPDKNKLQGTNVEIAVEQITVIKYKSDFEQNMEECNEFKISYENKKRNKKY